MAGRVERAEVEACAARAAAAPAPAPARAVAAPNAAHSLPGEKSPHPELPRHRQGCRWIEAFPICVIWSKLGRSIECGDQFCFDRGGEEMSFDERW